MTGTTGSAGVRPGGGIAGAIAPAGPGGPPTREAALRRTAVQLEGVFVQQLFQAMRATVPDDGLTAGGAGEQMFTGLLDEHLAQGMAHRVGGVLADALVRQLRGLAEGRGGQP